jgi:AraC-like DNA-binding protein
MDQLTLIDTATRLLTIGQLLLIALVIGRGRAPWRIRLAATMLFVCICAYSTIATPLRLDERGPFWALVQLAAQATPMMLWVFAHMLFERRLSPILVGIGLVVLVSCWIGFWLAGSNENQAGFWLGIIQRGTSLAMTLHAMQIAFSERGDDLIEKRRRLRVGFVIVVGILAVMVLVIEMIFGFRHTGVAVTLPQAIAILAATMALGAALLQSDPDILFDASADDRPNAPTLSPSEHVLKQKLDAAMAAGGYRETGLTIGILAQRLNTPEHRLRALINQRLGYRNFSAFLNHHRIAEAQALLSDPAHVDLPVLTIAMDLGYGSLAPFNRAFRELTALAPSEFRRAAILQN